MKKKQKILLKAKILKSLSKIGIKEDKKIILIFLELLLIGIMKKSIVSKKAGPIEMRHGKKLIQRYALTQFLIRLRENMITIFLNGN